MKIDKPILAWTIDDLELLRDDPYNLEDMNIEYKEQYSGNPSELRKDIVSFANSEVGGYILYVNKMIHPFFSSSINIDDTVIFYYIFRFNSKIKH